MRPHDPLFRLTAATAIGALLLGPLAAPFAYAQETPAPAAPSATDAEVTPPARVGRLGGLLGTVSFHTADDTSWQPATMNYPVTTGNAFWTEPLATAAIEVGLTRLVMDQQTEFDVNTLDDTRFDATLAQGEVYVRLTGMEPGETVSLTTPRGTITFTSAGRYGVAAGDTETPTRLTVLEGAADIQVGDVTLHVAPRQTAAISGTREAEFQGAIGMQANDPFLSAQLAKEQPPPRRVTTTVAYTPPPLVEKMTGYAAIREVGEWHPHPEYGHVWFPPVQRDWVPYRHGHWAFVQPWGWTWVDDAAWGFAPFHYGRWVEVEHRWGWIPVEPGVQVDVAVARPVYAPALVSFVNVGAAAVGAAVGVAAGLALGAAVGWVPLGPREVYRPAFRASPDYVRNVNVTHVSNVTNITNVSNVTNTTINNYANAQAATVVPQQAMTASQPVASAAQPVAPHQLAAATPVAPSQAPVAPTAATIGAVPAALRSPPPAPAPASAPAAQGTPSPAPTPPPRPIAPGPAIHPLATAAAIPANAPPPSAPPAAVATPAAQEPAKPALPPANPAPAGKAPASTAPAAPAQSIATPAVAAPKPLAKPVLPALPSPAKPAAAAPAAANNPVTAAKPAAAAPPVGAPKPANAAPAVTPAPGPKPVAPPAPPPAPHPTAAPQPAPAAPAHPTAPPVLHPAPPPALHPAPMAHAPVAPSPRPPALHPAHRPDCAKGQPNC